MWKADGIYQLKQQWKHTLYKKKNNTKPNIQPKRLGNLSKHDIIHAKQREWIIFNLKGRVIPWRPRSGYRGLLRLHDDNKLRISLHKIDFKIVNNTIRFETSNPLECHKMFTRICNNPWFLWNTKWSAWVASLCSSQIGTGTRTRTGSKPLPSVKKQCEFKHLKQATVTRLLRHVFDVSSLFYDLQDPPVPAAETIVVSELKSTLRNSSHSEFKTWKCPVQDHSEDVKIVPRVALFN